MVLVVRAISIVEKRAELRRILQSKYFSKAVKRSRFLEFVCEQSFQGQADQTSEYLVGVEVYQRGEEFNPHEDSIVRVQAHEIRKALKQYYSNDGDGNAIRLDLPPGHYIPRFSHATDESQSGPEPEAERPERMRPRLPWVLVLCLSLLSAVFATLLIQKDDANSSVSSNQWLAQYAAEMDWFWQPFLTSGSPPLVVIPVHPLLRAAHNGDTEKTQDAGVEVEKSELEEFRDTMHFRELESFRFVPSVTDFTAVGETLGLIRIFELFASRGTAVRVEAARLVDFNEIERNNTILLGGNQAWSGRIFLYRDGFWFHDGVITNSDPEPGEREVYAAEFDPITNDLRKDYALILMLPNERRSNRILLLYGIYTQGSQAAIEFVTSSSGLRELRRSLEANSPDGGRLPEYFQVLLETTVEDAVPGKTTVIATRTISPGAGS